MSWPFGVTDGLEAGLSEDRGWTWSHRVGVRVTVWIQDIGMGNLGFQKFGIPIFQDSGSLSSWTDCRNSNRQNPIFNPNDLNLILKCP